MLTVPTDGGRNSPPWTTSTAGSCVPREKHGRCEIRTDGGPPTVLDSWPAEVTGFETAQEFLAVLEREQTDPADYADLTDPICRHLLSHRTTAGYPPETVLASLRRILEATDPPVDAPSLIGLLDRPWLSRTLLLDHLLEQDQRPLSRIPRGLDIDVETIEDLPAKTRMHCYAALARGPGDPEVYSALSKAAGVFDGEIPMPGIDYDPDSWKRESGRRVVLAYARERREDIAEYNVKRALRASWTAVLPDLAPHITVIADAGLHEIIVERLDDGRGTSRLSGTPFIDQLVEQLLSADDSDTNNAIREIILTALQQGIHPADRHAVWERIDHAYRERRDTALAPLTTRLMTSSLASQVDVDSYIELITAGFPEQFPDRRGDSSDSTPQGQVEKFLKTLSAALGSGGADMLTSEQMAVLARVLVAAEGSCKEQAARCLSAATHGHQELLVESGGLETILEATATARTAEELNHYGKILKVAGVYPPPEQVLAHYGSTDETLDRAAKRLARSLRAPYRSNPPGPHPDDLDGTITELADQLTIKYHTDSGIWRPLSLSSPDRRLLSSVGQAIQEHESVQIALPYHDPQAFEVAMLAAVLVLLASEGESAANADAGDRPDYRDSIGNTPGLAIFSPGTSARWGTFTDLENCMERIGIDTEDRATASATPLIDLVPRGHVDDDGQVEPDTNSTTVADDPPCLPVVRDLGMLAALDPAVTLYNFLPEARNARLDAVAAIRDKNRGSETSTDTDTDTEIEQVDSRPSAALLDEDDDGPRSLPDHVPIEIYGLYTARKRDDWHIATGPPDDLPSPVVPGQKALKTGQIGAVADGGTRSPDETGAQEGLAQEGHDTGSAGESIAIPETMPPASGERASRGYAVVSAPPELTVHRVRGDGEMRGALEELYEAVSGIDGRNPATRTPHNRLQRVKRDLERLPVPAAYHDSWVREQRAAGTFGVPASLAERHNAARDMVDEYPVVARHISDAVRAIGAAREAIEDENPLFEGLLRILDDAHESEEHVGILCPKKTHKDILYSYLVDQSSIESSELDRLITLLDHDSVRTLGRDETDIDRLVRFGIGERQTAVFYCHPAVDRVDVLAYDGTRPVLRIEQVMAAGFPVFPKETAVSVAKPDIKDEVLTVSDGAPDTVEAFVDDDRSFEESLFVSFLTDSDEEGGSDGGGGSTADRYRITFESGESQTVFDTHPLVVKNRQQLVSEGEYTLQRVAETEPGDTVVVIPAETRNDLWETYLEPRYDGESVDWVIERIELWYEAIKTAMETVEPEGRESVGGAIYREIGDAIPEGRAAVRRWVRSVEQAEEARELLFRRELTIGPEYHEAVKAVADEYGDTRFQANTEEVFDTMQSVRREHANRGHDFWVDVANKACDGELFDRPGVTEKAVANISRVSNQ